MRVLLITQDFHPLKGGIARYLTQIKEQYFSKDKFKAIVPKTICNKKVNYTGIKKLVFHPFKTPSRRKESNKRLLNEIRNFNPDVILFGYLRSHPELIEEYKKIDPHVKAGVVLHGKEAFIDLAINKKTNEKGSQKGYTKEEAKEYKNIIEKMDFIICVSKFTKRIIKNQGIKNNRIFIINPVLKNLPEKKTEQNKEIVLLSVGRLIKRKGHEKVIRCLQEIKKSTKKKITYKIVGKGPQESNLKRLVEKKGLQETVNFEGEVKEEDLKDYYRNSDIFVLPTKFIKPNDVEGFGIVFIEANSHGKPVIGGNTGGVPEAIKSGSGYLVNPNSKKDIVDKLVDLCKNEEKRRTMGENGRKIVKENFFQSRNKEFESFIRRKK